VPGAVFDEVGVSLFVAGAEFREFLKDSRSAEMFYFFMQNASANGTRQVSEAAGAR